MCDDSVCVRFLLLLLLLIQFKIKIRTKLDKFWNRIEWNTAIDTMVHSFIGKKYINKRYWRRRWKGIAHLRLRLDILILVFLFSFFIYYMMIVSACAAEYIIQNRKFKLRLIWMTIRFDKSKLSSRSFNKKKKKKKTHLVFDTPIQLLTRMLLNGWNLWLKSVYRSEIHSLSDEYG